MDRICNQRQQLPILSMVLAGVMLCAFVADAAQEPYDIDLKELRRPPLRSTKEQPPHRTPGKSSAAAVNGKSSSYTVQPGDHLFLILMQHYGLSNEAAERLIPEIVRLNGIRKPKSLSVGQRLTIPLPTVTSTILQGRRQEPDVFNKIETAATRPTATETPSLQEVVAIPARPCKLVREVAEQLGVHVAPFSPFMDAEGLSMSHNTLKVSVVWFLAPAEAYTLERLLALQGVTLLLFKGDEAPRTVVEGVAGALKIPFSVSNTDTTAGLPLTYLFPAAKSGKDLSLTILSDSPVLK